MTHRPKIEQQMIAHIGRRHRFTCSCGARGPWQDKEGAELAQNRHAWETAQAGWSR